jgi:hypothetical protein
VSDGEVMLCKAAFHRSKSLEVGCSQEKVLVLLAYGVKGGIVDLESFHLLAVCRPVSGPDSTSSLC